MARTAKSFATEVKKYLGYAEYTVTRIADSNLVRLSATGILPCSNYLTQFEMRPEKVLPPMWDFVFFAQDTCEKALKGFTETTFMLALPGDAEIIVHDAVGIHEVPIQQANVTAADTPGNQTRVFARFPKSRAGHHGCIIAEADMLPSAYYYQALGPSSRDDCEKFIHDHCVQSDAMELRSGEVPWPLLS